MHMVPHEPIKSNREQFKACMGEVDGGSVWFSTLSNSDACEPGKHRSARTPSAMKLKFKVKGLSSYVFMYPNLLSEGVPAKAVSHGRHTTWTAHSAYSMQRTATALSCTVPENNEIEAK